MEPDFVCVIELLIEVLIKAAKDNKLSVSEALCIIRRVHDVLSISFNHSTLEG